MTFVHWGPCYRNTYYTCSIRCWNVAGALHNPNGIWLYSKKPTPGTENAVLCLSDSSISICQYPFFKSRHVKYLAPTNVSSVSSKQGNLYESVTVWLLSCLKSVHSLHVESFFRANTMFEFHELCDGHITPDFNISLILVFTSSNMPGGILLTLSLKGVSSFNRYLVFHNCCVTRASIIVCKINLDIVWVDLQILPFVQPQVWSLLLISLCYLQFQWSCHCHLDNWSFDIGCLVQQ